MASSSGGGAADARKGVDEVLSAEEDGFVQLDKVSAGVFRYEVRLANGQVIAKPEPVFPRYVDEADTNAG